MLVDREKFLVFAAALAACHQARVHESVTSAPTLLPLATASSPAPAAEASGVCAELWRANQAALSTPTGACPTSEPKLVDEVRKQLLDASHNGLFDFCHDGHGTWAVLVASADLSEPEGESGKWCGATIEYQLVFVSTKRERTVSRKHAWSAFRDSTSEASIAAVFDFDGDGSDELVLASHQWGNGGGSDDGVEVLHATSTMEPYPVGFPITGVTDADGDGRPDFVDGGFFAASPPCFGLYPVDRVGVPLLVHSLPDGTFTMSDETARRWARLQCPSAPSKASTADPLTASCKRLWGQSVAQITRGLPSAAGFCGQPKSSEAEVTTALIRRPPPFATLDVNTPDPLPQPSAPKR